MADGPSTNDADAIAYRQLFGSRRVFIVDPMVQVFNTVIASAVNEPASARVAGLIARTDQQDGIRQVIVPCKVKRGRYPLTVIARSTEES